MADNFTFGDPVKDSGSIPPIDDPKISYPVFDTSGKFSISDQTNLNIPPKNDLGLGVYNEPQNDKKLFGANIDVLYTLEKIKFNKYSDGALQQNIAYIKFYGDSNVTRNVVNKSLFNSITPNSDLQKCYDLKNAKDCSYSFSNDFKYTPLFNSSTINSTSPIMELGSTLKDALNFVVPPSAFTQANSFSIASDIEPLTRYETDYNTFKSTLPAELANLLPQPPTPKTLLEKIENTISTPQDIKNKALIYKSAAEDFLNKIPLQNNSIVNTIKDSLQIVELLSSNVDKYTRIASQIFDKVGFAIETWSEIRGFFDRLFNDLDIPLDSPLPGTNQSDRFGIDSNLKIPLGASVLDEIFSADISSDNRVNKITTYDCKETLSKKEGIWQFLFNPSQLQYNYNTDYASADTWANPEGKPLHWKGNNNPELQFSDILINGYMFGRKVESLAQGLKDLMLFNSNEPYQGSPPVLEFIWGAKRFGPCMMKDLSITEEMWDGGILVNAKCNFTLVKIPEWTINDGQVDIFDPARTPVFIPRPSGLLNDGDLNADEEDIVTGDGDGDGDGEDDNGKEDPIVTLDPNAINVNDPTCIKIKQYLPHFKIVEDNFDKAYAKAQELKGWRYQEDLIKYADKLFKNPDYYKWYKSAFKIIEELGTKDLFNYGMSINQRFLSLNPKCDYKAKNQKNGGEIYLIDSHGLLSANIIKQSNFSLAASRRIRGFAIYKRDFLNNMRCYMDLIRSLKEEMNNRCVRNPNASKDSKSSLVSLAVKNDLLCQYIINHDKAISWISINPLTSAQLSRRIVQGGEIFSSQFIELLRQRKDLQDFYTKMNNLANGPGAKFYIKNPPPNKPNIKQTYTCLESINLLKDLSNDPNGQKKAQYLANINQWALMEFYNSIKTKCLGPAEGIANKYKKQLNCTK